jgi:hypothetical protein
MKALENRVKDAENQATEATKRVKQNKKEKNIYKYIN